MIIRLHEKLTFVATSVVGNAWLRLTHGYANNGFRILGNIKSGFYARISGMGSTNFDDVKWYGEAEMEVPGVSKETKYLSKYKGGYIGTPEGFKDIGDITFNLPKYGQPTINLTME